MKTTTRKMTLGGGGYRTLLLVVAALGLFSLIGCGGTTSSDDGTTSSDDFAGTWTSDDGKTLTFTPGGGEGNGSVTGSLLPEGSSYYYVLHEDDLSQEGDLSIGAIYMTGDRSAPTATVSVNPDDKSKLTYLYESGAKQVILSR